MLAANISTLPKDSQESVRAFFTENEEWLAGLLNEGKDSGEFSFEGTAESEAKFVFSSIQGALLVSRAMKSEARFIEATGALRNALSAKK